MSQKLEKIFFGKFLLICDKQGGLGVFLAKAFQRKGRERQMTQAEFIPLAERYKDTVYRIALNYYGSSYDADDTVQDVMLKLFQRKESFESEEHARYWLIRVTINQCKNSLLYYEELSVNKIALLLGIKSTAVTTRLSRARQKLKTKLTEVWKDEE